MNQNWVKRFALPLAIVSMFAIIGCGGEKPAESGKEQTKEGGTSVAGGADYSNLSGTIVLDGSSTVAPISEAIAEEFGKAAGGKVKISVGTSGTGGGFKKFLAKETDISDASRPIKASEDEAAVKNQVEYIEIPIAYDGLSLVVHPSNTWAEALTVAELKTIWEPDSKINNWKDVRAGFPDKPLKLYGAGTDSGTFDYFTEAIVGKERASRSDYTASEDDNTLVQGIAGDEGSLGYFGYSYYEENSSKLKLVGVDSIKPSPETILDGTYKPLSRPLFIYVRKDVADRPEVQAFLQFYLTEGRKLIKSVGYVPLPDKVYELALERLKAKKTGSVFKGDSHVGVKMEDLLSKEAGQ